MFKSKCNSAAATGNFPISNETASCFLCFKNKVTPSVTVAALEVHGIPNTNEDKLNILKVICQLLRVEWKLMESLFNSSDTPDNVQFPFCLTCLKFVIDIICLREQLFQIESDIREKIRNIETSVVQVLENGGESSQNYLEEDEEVGMEEQPETYDDYRRMFQKQIRNEYCNKHLLQQKTEKLERETCLAAIELQSSLVQLQFSKNVYKIAGRKAGKRTVEITGDCKNDIQPEKYHLSKPSVSRVPELTDGNGENGRVDKDASDDSTEDSREVFELDFDQQTLDEIQILDEYGTPSKQMKLQFNNNASLKRKVDGDDESDSSWSGDEMVVNVNASDFSGSDANSSDELGDSEDEEEEMLEMNPGNLDNMASISANLKRLKKKRKKQNEPARKGPVSVKTLNQNEEIFLAKDETVWTTKPPRTRKTRQFKMSKEECGLIGKAKNSKLSPVEIFKLLFPESMIGNIAHYTNKYAESLHGGDKKWNPVTTEEIYAYIGILIYLGAERKRNIPTEEIWSSNPKYLLPCVIATMSRVRFIKISNFMRFDDRAERQTSTGNGNSNDRLGYICEIFNPFVQSIESYFCPSGNLVVDEMMVKYKGSVRFRIFMKPKPETHGMKLWALCDSATGYVLRLAVYEGKIGDDVETRVGQQVVLGLVEKYFDTGRVVTTDNFLTSKSLGEELLKRRTGLMGTVNQNQMDAIPDFAEGGGREVESSIFVFQNDFTMVSYARRKNRNVVLLSTEHHSANVVPDRKKKPQIILDYNSTKRGLDTANQMISNYSCQRATRKWPMKLFQAMIDVGTLNAYIIWKTHRRSSAEKLESRRLFLRALSEGLTEPFMAGRSQRDRAYFLPATVQKSMVLMGYNISEKVPTWERFDSGCCAFCTGKRTNIRCHKCRRFACNDHSMKVPVCRDCGNVPHSVTKVKVPKPNDCVVVPHSVKEPKRKFVPFIFGISEIPDAPSSSDLAEPETM